MNTPLTDADTRSARVASLGYLKLQILPLKPVPTFFSWNTLFRFCGLLMMVIHDDSSPSLETVVKQRDVDSMSIDELFMLHERITALLAAKITAEKEALIDRLKQADMRMH